MSQSHATGHSLSSSLLDRLRHRDDAAWQRLTDLYGPAVYARCRRAGLSPADSADATQEVFVAVARAINSFRRDDPASTFRGWIFTITRNKIHDHFRKLATQPTATGGTDFHQRLQSFAAVDDFSSSDIQTERDDRQAILGRAAELVRAEFEDATWRAFWLTAVAGRSPAEAAAELGVSVNAVYKSRSRVLRRLREELADLL
jgi:RNA polymerase sigma-70 factor (ECF subfamily)